MTENPYTAPYPKKELSEEEKTKHIRHFKFFSLGSIIYALFYTFCLYKNGSGITYPFFIGGTLFYFFLSLRRLGITAKKDSIFYIISLLLLGISTFLTDDGEIIFMNKMGIFVLSFVLIIHNFYRDEKWNFSKYINSILHTIFGSIGEVGSPVSDLTLYLEVTRKDAKKKIGKRRSFLLGLLISIPLLLVVILLLYSADIVFASLMDRIMENIQIPQKLTGIIFTILFAFFASYCLITYMDKKKITEEVKDRRTGEPVIAITFTSILSAIYLLFCGIQIIYLFSGSMTLPYDYTFAEYAREGFFQLLFICILNLALVLVCLERFRESKVLKALLTVISVCTYIMIASSAMRMIMYISRYYLTFLRIFVLWSLFVIFLLITGVLITIYKDKFPLFKYSMIIVTVLYIAISFSHPDYIIAKYNVAFINYNKDTDTASSRDAYSDFYYISHLSADAAPVFFSDENISEYLNSFGMNSGSVLYDDCWLEEYQWNLDYRIEDMDFRSFNLSRYIAKRYMNKLSPTGFYFNVRE